MMDHDLYERVKTASRFQNPEDIRVFEQGVWKLVEKQDEETFKNLIELFDDDTDYPEVMFNLVHALESYPDEKYIILFLDALRSESQLCGEWYARLIVRILNEDKCKYLFTDKLNSINSLSKNKIINLVKKYYPEKDDQFFRLSN